MRLLPVVRVAPRASRSVWCALLCTAVAVLSTTSSLPGQTPLTGPGVSAALATARRAQLRDVAYDLAFTLTAGDHAAGTVTVAFTRVRGGDVVLDFRGRALRAARVNGVSWDSVAAHWNGHHVTVPASRLRPGRNTVSFAFETPVAAAGAAIIRSRDVTDSSTYLYTLLVPSDANLLFPCFDQPDLKARVTLSLTTPASWRALANGAPVADGARGANGSAVATAAEATVTHRFATTPPISTYLIAFAAGPWRVHTRADVIVDGTPAAPMSMYVRASRANEAEGDSLLAMNARALRWLARYFGVPYAFGKYDMLLAPAFPFGGMEHPGAVFYNEDSFIYRERPTAQQLLGRQATTFHEVAHQWFGDYVTMRWFDDLWLKEGFATFMAARMQADLEPTSGAWKTFYLRNKPVAYGTDATAGTTPVWQALGNLDQAKSNYGPIVYNKAPSVLRQLEYLVGPRAFQRGVRQFLRQHAYGNATWQSLLAAVGAAAGRDLGAWGRAWMLRPGMPIVTQRVEVQNGRIARLQLVQRAAQPSVSGHGAWPLKVQVRLHYADAPAVSLPVELRGDTTNVTAAVGRPAPAFVFANEGDYGYAIVLPDSASVRWLESHVSEIRDDFLRAMLWGAMWDLVREGELAPGRFVRMAMAALPQERDEQLASALVSRLSTAVGRYSSPAERDALLPEVEALLLRGAQDERATYGTRKSQLDAFVALARREPALRQLRGWLAGDSAAGLPLRAPTRWALVTRLVGRGAADADALIAAEVARDNTSDGRRSAFVAAAARPDSAFKRALFTRFFADTALNEEWVTSSLRAFHDADLQSQTLPLLEPALDSLPWIQRNRRIFFLGSWLSGTLGGQTSPEALAVVDRWLSAHPTLAPDLRQKVLQARDELERTVRIRAQAEARGDSAAVLQVVEQWLSGLNDRDNPLLQRTILPRGWSSLAVMTPGASAPRMRLTNDSALYAARDSRTGVGALGARTLSLHGSLAVVSAPYVWITPEQTISHCGTDVFTVARHDGQWRMINISYTLSTTGCPTAAQLPGRSAPRPERPAPGDPEAQSAVQVSEAVLRALSARDTASLRGLLTDEVMLQSVADPAGSRTVVATQEAASFFRTLPQGKEALLERLWAPTVAVYGALAFVHAPYDFHLAGAFSHCGTDVFTLVRLNGSWRVARIAYTVRRTGCPASPLGPPAR